MKCEHKENRNQCWICMPQKEPEECPSCGKTVAGTYKTTSGTTMKRCTSCGWKEDGAGYVLTFRQLIAEALDILHEDYDDDQKISIRRAAKFAAAFALRHLGESEPHLETCRKMVEQLRDENKPWIPSSRLPGYEERINAEGHLETRRADPFSNPSEQLRTMTCKYCNHPIEMRDGTWQHVKLAKGKL